MLQEKTYHPFFYSIIFHIIVLSILIVSFEFNACNYVVESSDSQKIVNAVLVTNTKIQMPDPSPMPATKTPEVIKKTIPVKASSPVLAQPKSIIIPDNHKKLIAKQLLADLKKEVDQQKKIKHHKEITKEFEKELKAQAAKSLQQQLLAEKTRLSSAQSEKMQGIIDKYKALILQAIANHWLVPTGADKNASTELRIRLSAAGTVLEVELVKSSGDDALDRSARSAVFKSSPLPVPTNSDEFAPFKEFILKVKPLNVLARDNGLT